MDEYTKYLFHPRLEIFRCGGGVLMCYIFGNRISLFEESIDEDFSLFISQNIKTHQPFSVKDMRDFFSDNKKYNFPKILQGLKNNGLINEVNSKNKSLVLVNLTGISDEEILTVSREVNIEPPLILINGLKPEGNDGEELCKKLEEKLKDDSVVFVMSDLKNKHKISILNLYFFKKGISWCPVVVDVFGGYIGPLMHSDPSGPCFSCYEERMYRSGSSEDKDNDSNSLPVLLEIFLRIAFFEAFKVGTSVSPSQLIYSNLLEIDCFNHRSRKHYIYPDSDCPVCGI